MEKKIVLVIFGGKSPEYEVSLKSAAAVINNLDTDQYELMLVGITRDGRWFRYIGETDKIENNTWFESDACVPAFITPSREFPGLVECHNGNYKFMKIDVVFPVLHGKNGEDGTLQGLLELAGLPFVGCGALSSGLCMDKDVANILAQWAGVKTPRYIAITKNMDHEAVLAATSNLDFPLYVKPANTGSSIGITKADNQDELLMGIATAFEHDGKVVIEENIVGFEVGCAVLGNEELLVGAVDEIELQDGFFNFNEKYTLATSKIHMPARIEPELARKVQDTAVTLYKALGCAGLARVDMFVTPAGEIIFNEINTIPGFTTNSRYPNMLCHTGLTFSQILDKLIVLAMERAAYGRN